MFNLPPSIFNNPYLQNLAGQAKKQGWSEVNPFRTVNDSKNGDSAGAYGKGLNASAAQLYDHFRQNGGWAVNAGLPKAGLTQSIDSFLQRFNPQPVQPPQMPVPPPKNPVASGGFPNFNFGNFNPSMLNGIFNTQPTAPQSFPGLGQPQQMDRPMAMPSGGPAPQQAIPMPNMNAGIFNMPQFNRR